MKLQLCLVVCFVMLASCTFGGSANIDQGLLAEPLYNESIMDGQENNDFSRVSGLSTLIDNPLSYRGLNEANKDDISEPNEKSTGLGDSSAKRARPHRNNQRRRPIIRGKYRFLAPDGTIRTIKYISDQNGIHHVVPSRQTDNNLSLTTLSDGIKNRLGMTNALAPLSVLPLGVGLQSPSNGILLAQQANKLGLDYSLKGQYAPGDNFVVVTPRPTQLTSQFGLTPLLIPQQIDNIGFGQLPLTGLPTLGNLFPVQQFRLPFNTQQFMPRQLESNQNVQGALPGQNVYQHPAIRQENFLPGYGMAVSSSVQ